MIIRIKQQVNCYLSEDLSSFTGGGVESPSPGGGGTLEAFVRDTTADPGGGLLMSMFISQPCNEAIKVDVQ